MIVKRRIKGPAPTCAPLRWLAAGLIAVLVAGCAAPPAPPPRAASAIRQPAKPVKQPESKPARRTAQAPRTASTPPSSKSSKQARQAAAAPKSTARAPAPEVQAPQPAPPVDTTPVPASERTFMRPTPGAVLARFDGQRNKGVDFAGAEGDPVYAARGGQVVYSSGGLRGYGRLLIIKHDANLVSAYAHNSELLVKEGQKVKRGQLVARMGSTDADRVKLHFELRREGKAVDPMGYLDRAPSR